MASKPTASAQGASPQPPQNAAPSPDFRHVPVLLGQVLSVVPPHARLMVDATVGGAGHAQALLEAFPAAELLAADRDPTAARVAGERLAGFEGRVLVRCMPFDQVPHQVAQGTVDFLLADLGVSSHQLDEGARGFSFMREGPLDMRMNPDADHPTAAEMVAQASVKELTQLIYDLGEDRFGKTIAQAIVEARGKGPITTTTQLAAIVERAVPGRFQRHGHHPATKTFQALRMAVNDELGQLESLLSALPHLLSPGGRAAIISFHSLEDRMVKEHFRDWENPCKCPPELPRCVCGLKPLGKRVTKKPLEADAVETQNNPRARSAKLRVFEKA